MPLPVTPETAPTLAAPVILVLTGAGLFIGAIVRGWTTGAKDKDKADAKAGDPPTQNVALAGALIDSSSAKQLSRALTDLGEQMESAERSERRMCETMDRLETTMRRSADQSEENVRTLKLLVEGLPRTIASALRNEEMLRAVDRPVPTPADDPLIPARMRRGDV